jgi:hypothetical protein
VVTGDPLVVIVAAKASESAYKRWNSVLSLDHPYSSWPIALGIGLLIGVERERRKGEGPGRAAAGLRTFAITSLLGAASMEIGGAELLSVTTAGVLALTALAYYQSHAEDPGLTTEIALVLTLVLGGLATAVNSMKAAVYPRSLMRLLSALLAFAALTASATAGEIRSTIP